MTLRMPPDIYQMLLEKVRPLITKMTTNFRKPISAEERLTLTLRYLALCELVCIYNLKKLLYSVYKLNTNSFSSEITIRVAELYTIL